MLGQLFGSNARVKILKIFLFNPEERYYIRQLARDLKLQVNSVRRELDNLEKFGILISAQITSEEAETKGKSVNTAQDSQEKKYYQANADFVLFEEIKALIIKAQILYGRDFISKLNKAGNAKLLVLSGKFVNEPDFPVDLLVVGRFDKVKLVRLIKELERELGREINYVLMDTREFNYRREITDVFLYNILAGKNIIAVDNVGIS